MSRTLRAAALAVLTAFALAAPASAATDLVISEFRTRGPVGGNDEFVEIRNKSSAPVDISGLQLQGCAMGSPGTASTRATVASGVTLAAGQAYLFTNNNAGGGYSGSVPGDQTYGTGFTDFSPTNFAGIRIVRGGGTLLDGVGAPNSPCHEGVGILTPGPDNGDHGFERLAATTDTDSNAADFIGPKASDPQNRAATAPAVRVTDTEPDDGAADVPVDTNVRVTFSEPVSADDSSFSITCGPGGPRAFALSTSDSTTYTLDPADPLPTGRSCTVTVDTAEADDSFSFTTEGLRLRIHEIQGAQHRSPVVGELVSGVPGVVTARRSNGFYVQDPQPDADARTSEALFVFTGGAPPAAAAVGLAVRVSGRVTEFRPGGAATNLTTTEITQPTVTPDGTGTVAATTVGEGGRVPPATVIDDDSMGDVELNIAGFDPAQDGIDFYESLEAMLVQINDAVVVGPTNDFRELWVLGDGGRHASVRTPRGGIVIRPGDFNPERIQLDDVLAPLPDVSVRDRFAGPVRAVVDYDFGNFQFLPVESPARVDGGLQREVTATPHRNQLATATLNVENLDPGDGPAKLGALAQQIVGNLQSPDLLSLEEIQDNNGPVNDTTTDASATYAALIAAIAAAGGPAYDYRQIDPVDDQDGGEPGGNIRVGFLFRTDRGLTFVDQPGGTSTSATGDDPGRPGAQLTFSPGRIDPTNPAFSNSRKPLAGEFRFRGRKLFAIANHFNSKGGDDPLFGRFQPPKRPTEAQRHEQARIVNRFVKQLVGEDRLAQVVVLGDLNDFDFSETLRLLKGREMFNLMDLLPRPARYSYDFEGNSQVLDQILVTWPLLLRLPQYDSVHVNAEFHDQVSDHDPQVARFWFPGDSR